MILIAQIMVASLSVVCAALITGYCGYAAYVTVEQAKIEKIEEVVFVSSDMAARCTDMQAQLERIEKRCIQAKNYTMRSWADCEIIKGYIRDDNRGNISKIC